ncbi:MAG TPA: DNA methyltransferase [Acidimicrobiales bacterium]|nr:DNA methyltransferase [Acidimicrobiales bacterium]
MTETSRTGAAGSPPGDGLPPGQARAAARAIEAALDRDGVALLAPCDVHRALAVVREAGLRPRCAMLDPWYNKGVGGVRDDYEEFLDALVEAAAGVADHVYLWGFPEIVARRLDRLPAGLSLVAWLTWYYKNNPSVIRGWRSAQMTCLHLARPGAPLHPEAFLTEAQAAKQAQGKLRYMPGPPSVLEGQPDVIEEPLLVGFVGRREQTGHPSQKPRRVFETLLRMVLAEGEVVVDPLCGSGTTGAAARAVGGRAVLADHDPAWVAVSARRLGVTPLDLPSAP